MLYEFITTYRDAIIARSREKLTARPWPTASEQELENGVPTFLTQLSEALRAESTGAHESPAGIGSAATRHGQELMALGFTANQQRRERMFVAPLLEDIGAGGLLHAESRGMQFAIEPSDPTWEVTADPQLIASAVTNLLNNAFKHTKPGGRVVLRAQTDGNARLQIAVQDECGGIPLSEGDPFQSFAKRCGRDRTGLGLGLSIARKAVRAHGGDIYIRNLPGQGCIFTIELPMAAEATTASSRAR